MPVLAGMTKAAVQQLPTDTLFMAVTDQHWLLCLKGANRTLVFDCLGLPISALSHICHGVPILPWNRYGYQASYSSVCGYYIIAILIAMQHGNLTHNADVDRILANICHYHIPRPEDMSEFFAWHRHYNKQLAQNDKEIVDYVHHVYPNVGWLDSQLPPLAASENHAGVLGSPLYAHAGIKAASVYQQFAAVNAVKRAADPQRHWPGLGEMLVSQMASRPTAVSEPYLRFQTAASRRANDAAAIVAANTQDSDQTIPPSSHFAGPDPRRKLTAAERTLWSRSALNAFNPPSGVNASGDDQSTLPPSRAINSTTATTNPLRRVRRKKQTEGESSLAVPTPFTQAEQHAARAQE